MHGLKDGWIDGGSIFLAIILVISVSAVSNFRQNRQFDKLSKVSDNVQIEAVRGGRRQQILIFEIVVGDVICLKIGDQVPDRWIVSRRPFVTSRRIEHDRGE